MIDPGYSKLLRVTCTRSTRPHDVSALLLSMLCEFHVSLISYNCSIWVEFSRSRCQCEQLGPKFSHNGLKCFLNPALTFRVLAQAANYNVNILYEALESLIDLSKFRWPRISMSNCGTTQTSTNSNKDK